jgi:hypothetical protein
LTDLGNFTTIASLPKRSHKPLRNKGISRFSLAGRRTVVLSTTGARKFADDESGSPSETRTNDPLVNGFRSAHQSTLMDTLRGGPGPSASEHQERGIEIRG